jgi:hypothetical protein
MSDIETHTYTLHDTLMESLKPLDALMWLIDQMNREEMELDYNGIWALGTLCNKIHYDAMEAVELVAMDIDKVFGKLKLERAAHPRVGVCRKDEVLKVHFTPVEKKAPESAGNATSEA